MPWNAVAAPAAKAGWICYLSLANVQLAPQLSFQKEATERLWPSLGSRNGDLEEFVFVQLSFSQQIHFLFPVEFEKGFDVK